MEQLSDYIGSLFYFSDSPDLKKRIIEIDSDKIFMIDMNKRLMTTPLCIEVDTFKHYINEGEVIFIKEEAQVENSLEELSPYQQKKTQKRWESIGLRWRDPEIRGDFLNPKRRSSLIAKIAEELGITKGQVRKLITRFWRGGMNRNSLTPQKRGVEKGMALNQGRKPKGGTGLTINKEVEDYFSRAYRKYHLGKGFSLEKTFTNLLKDYYTQPKSKESREYVYRDPEKTPTINQFRYWVRKHRDAKEEIESRVGSKEFDNSYSILTDATTTSTMGAGVRAELDATHLPIELVSEYDRSLCIGTPLLELVVDVYSKMIMGFLLTLENESYRTGALAVFNCGENKQDFARKFDLEIRQEDWPVQHLPQIILTDNGPFKSRYSEVMERDFHVYLENAAARKGSAKGNIERRNRTFSDYVRESLPGATKNPQKGRGAVDPADSACLTLRELTRIIIKKIIELNHSVIRDYPLSPEAIQAGVTATPVNLWKWSMQKVTDHLIYINNPDLLKMALLPRVKGGRVVRREGIRWNNFIYTSKDPEVQKWLLNHMGEKVEIAFNSIDLRNIFIIYDNRIFPLELNEKSKGFSLLSKEEAEYYQRLKSSQDSKQKDEDQLLKIETIEMENSLIKTSSTSKKEKKNKKGNRRKEIRNERIKEATGDSKTEEKTSEAGDYESDERIQSKLFQERINRIKKNRKNHK